jgi:chromosome segregation ATPase
MNSLKRFATSLGALLIISSLALAGPVAAEHGGGSDDSSSETTLKTASSTEVHNLTGKLRQQGEAELQAKKQTVKQKTEAEREKSCTARKNNLTKRMANSVKQAQKHKAVIDKAYARVKTFHDSKNLNTPDYASLTAAIDTAQTNAQNSINALKSLDVNVDCTSQTVASTVSSYQQAVKNTRDSLKTYRKALVDLIKAMKGASTGTGSQNDSTNTSTQ